MRPTDRLYALLLAMVPLVLAAASEAAPITPIPGTGAGEKSRQAPRERSTITVRTEKERKELEENVKKLQAQSASIAMRLEKVLLDLKRLEDDAQPGPRSSAAFCIAINSIKLEIESLNSQLDTKSNSELIKDASVLDKSLSLLISEKQKRGILCEGDS